MPAAREFVHALRCAASAALAFAAAAAGGALAVQHPLWPATLAVAFGVWALAVFRWPGLWLFMVPALLPLAEASPWTGWTVFSEFDLLLLGTIAGGHARLALEPGAVPSRRLDGLTLLIGLQGLLSLLALQRGLADAGPFRFDLFAGPTSPMNGLRLFKPLLWAMLVLPLLRCEVARSPEACARRVGAGMVVGLAAVTLAVLWERGAYPGLFDFSAPYRTSALFWEMHFGGAAIDGYLALAMPFAAWALWRARTPAGWAGAAALALGATYAALTTFSRGVYLAVTLPLLLAAVLQAWHSPDGRAGRLVRRWAPTAAALVAAGALFWLALLTGGYPELIAVLLVLLLVVAWQLRRSNWRRLGASVLAVALVFEVVAVGVGGNFMARRLSASASDFGSRLAHWQHGLAQRHGTADRLWGIGLGRLPARYAAQPGPREFSGAARWLPVAEGGPAVTLSGPASRSDIGGLWALTQRVPLRPGSPHWVQIEVRAERPIMLLLALCQRHLLYDADCQTRELQLRPTAERWQALALPLDGPPLDRAGALLQREGVFSLSMLTPGGRVDLRRVGLQAPGGAELLVNGDFGAGLAHWWPAGQEYFLPWHIDNLFLEWLIERGAAGLLLFLMLAGTAFAGQVRGGGTLPGFSPFLAAALAGAALVGLVSSLMDMPRIAFLLWLLLFLALEPRRPKTPALAARQADPPEGASL